MGSEEEIIKDLRLRNKSNEKEKSAVVIVKHSICELIVGKIVCQKEKLFVGVIKWFKNRIKSLIQIEECTNNIIAW